MIKNIIFDFGGVIYDIDHNLSKIAFEKLGVENFEQLYGHHIQIEKFEEFDRGELPEKNFIDYLKTFLPKNTTDQQIIFAWNALLLGFEKEKIDFVESLAEYYKIFVLSNTNILHHRQFIEELYTYKNFHDIFEDVWFSHEVGMRKPESRIYHSLLEKHQLKADESLFIDDLEKNIIGAKEVGLETYFLHNEDIRNLFEEGRLKMELLKNSPNFS